MLTFTFLRQRPGYWLLLCAEQNITQLLYKRNILITPAAVKYTISSLFIFSTFHRILWAIAHMEEMKRKGNGLIKTAYPDGRRWCVQCGEWRWLVFCWLVKMFINHKSPPPGTLGWEVATCHLATTLASLLRFQVDKTFILKKTSWPYFRVKLS